MACMQLVQKFRQHGLRLRAVCGPDVIWDAQSTPIALTDGRDALVPA